MCPNASIMPSLARTRLATANSWRSSAKESGMAGSLRQLWQWTGSSGWRIASSEWRIESLTSRRSRGRLFVSGASDLAEKIGEFVLDLLPQLGARARDHGKIRKALEWPAGIDDGARIGRACLVEHGIERSAPGAAHEFDVVGRVAARAHRPHHVEQVGRIDILVDHDDEAPEIGGRLAAGRQQPRLARMAGIGLLDSDDVEHARAAEFVHPHAGDPRQSRALDLVPDHAGFHHAFAEGEIGRRAHRRGDAEDRIVAVIDALDLHQRLLAWARGVIARELAERSFLRRDVLDHLAFEHDLGVRRHRQAVKLAQHDLVRLTAVAAGIVVFAETEFELVAAGEE